MACLYAGFNSNVSSLMKELHAESIDGGAKPAMGLGHVPGRGRTPTKSWLKKKFVKEKAEKIDQAKAPPRSLRP